MERYITDASNLTYIDLHNLDWDIIELPITVDYKGLLNWYRSVEDLYPESKFAASKEYERYFDPKSLNRWKAADPTFDDGKPSYWWMLNWNRERDDPLPFSHLADLDQFPEVNDPSFSDKTNPILSKYRFGAFEELYQKASKYLLNMRLLVMPENTGLHVHVDAPFPSVIIRMHMNLNIHENCVWYFGHSAEREYRMSPGKVYLVNTAVFHSVINHGGDDWILVYGTPKREDLETLFKLKNFDD